MDKYSFEFELNMDDSYKNYETIDEWEMATVWVEDYGAEYNLCLQNGDNYSAIYFMEHNDETDYWDTDSSCFEHYEIDFNNPNWKLELKETMYNFVINMINKKK